MLQAPGDRGSATIQLCYGRGGARQGAQRPEGARGGPPEAGQWAGGRGRRGALSAVGVPTVRYG